MAYDTCDYGLLWLTASTDISYNYIHIHCLPLHNLPTIPIYRATYLRGPYGTQRISETGKSISIKIKNSSNNLQHNKTSFNEDNKNYIDVASDPFIV